MRPGRQVEFVPTFFCQRRAFNLPKRTGEHEAMRKIITHKQAKALGLKRYFTGEPCKHGHIAERLTNCRGQCVPLLSVHDRARRQSLDDSGEHGQPRRRDLQVHRFSGPLGAHRHARCPDIELSDATIVRHNGIYYLFGVLWDGAGGYSDMLAILLCRRSVRALAAARGQPRARRSFDRAARRQLRAAKRTAVASRAGLRRRLRQCPGARGSHRADADTRSARSCINVLKPGQFWPGRKLHTLNRSGRLEVIDGSRIQPKPTALAAAWKR